MLIIRNNKITKEELFSLMEDEFSNIGLLNFSDSGKFIIDSAKFNSSFHKSGIKGSLQEKGEKFLIELDYTSTFTTLGWVVFIITLFFSLYAFIFLLGIFIFLLPFLAKKNMNVEIEKILEKIRFNIK